MQLPTGVMYVSNFDLFTCVLLFDCEKSRFGLNMFRLVFVYKRFWLWKMYTFLFTVQVLCETNKGRPSSKDNYTLRCSCYIRKILLERFLKRYLKRFLNDFLLTQKKRYVYDIWMSPNNIIHICCVRLEKTKIRAALIPN